jgi:methylenetetrahydrofolate dehydrogenase (NADP+) / methenyltetrahydrofolate cyclohydrolase
MKILDGKKVNKKIESDLFLELTNSAIKPVLKIIQIGNDDSSNIYISQKIKFAEAIGARANVLKFVGDMSCEAVISEINKVNSDPSIHGIIVQLPIPSHLDKSKIIDSINPIKDVDGLTRENISRLLRNEGNGIIPATTRGIFEILDHYKIKISGKNVVIIGRSNLVGRPTAINFLNRDATVTICHSKTKDLKDKVRKADIVVSAIGKPGFLNKGFFNKNQVIIGIGISRDKKGKITGDIDIKGLNARAFTPVPGGIGPMTVACLFKNLFDSYKKQLKMQKR